jgi:F-type H+-transporting ATPase subunit delta
VERIAEVYARALFEAAQGLGAIDAVRDQLAAFVDALHGNRNLMIFFFSPYFSAQEKKEGLRRALSDADETFMQFLEVLLESHRMPVIFAIKDRYERFWRDEKKLLPVEVTSAVGLDSQLVDSLGDRIGQQTGREVELVSRVDPEILGGIVLRVGNFVLDASIRNQLNQLRKQVAQA